MLLLVAFIGYMLWAKKHNESQLAWLYSIWNGDKTNTKAPPAPGATIVADEPVMETRPIELTGTGNEDMASGVIDTGVFHNDDVNTLIK